MKEHVVAFAVPSPGHFNPMFRFILRLAESGTVVTFVNTEACYAELLKANGGQDPFMAAAGALGLDIKSIAMSDGLPLEFDRYNNRDEFCESMRSSMVYNIEKLLSKLVMHESPPVSCLLADTIFHWAADIAQKFELPLASFCTQSVAVYSMYSHIDDLIANKHLPYPETADCNEKVIDYLRGLPSMRIVDLPSYLQETDLNNVIYKSIVEAFEYVRKADWVISNTVDELEPSTVSALKESGIPFLSVGPLLPQEFMDTIDNPAQPREETKFSCRTSLLTEFDLSAWLGSKPKESVLYISFGSISRCSKELLQEFAMGLMQSKQSFVWVLRPDVMDDCSAVEEAFPEGFTEAIKDQGIIVKWCNQLDVLRHPSVGAFVTHCGWNSILEGLWIGVPLLAFPFLTDQYTNSWLITEQLGIAKSLGLVNSRSNGSLRVAVPRHEIATCLANFMTRAEQRNAARAKAEWAKGVIRKAVMDENGSSVRNFKLFLEGYPPGRLQKLSFIPREIRDQLVSVRNTSLDFITEI